MLKDALKRWELRRDRLRKLFDNSLLKFNDEEKTMPTVIGAEYVQTESSIVRLQLVQAMYNLTVKLKLTEEREISLCEAIKSLGAQRRTAAMWLAASNRLTNPIDMTYGFDNQFIREEGKVVAKPTMSDDDALNLSMQADQQTTVLKSAIAIANATELDIEGFDSALLE